MTKSTIPPQPESSHFTRSQWQAIYQSGSDLLVSASAGSGKTTVLVQRVMEKILQGTPVDRLLIVTFTEKAAKEMKERIEKRLQESLSSSQGQQAHYLRQQLLLLPDAYISTLHAFCKRLIDRYHFLLDLDPQFALLTKDSQIHQLQEEAWIALQEEGYQKDEAFIRLAQDYGSHKGDDNFRFMIERLDTFSRVTPDPDAFYQSALSAYQGIEGDINFEKTALYQDYLLPYLKEELIGLEKKAQALIDLSEGLQGQQTKWLAYPLNLDQWLKNVIENLIQSRYDAALHLFQDFGQGDLKIPTLSKKMKESEDGALLMEIGELAKAIQEAIKDLKASIFFESAEGHLHILRAAQQGALEMIRLAKRYREILQDKKRQMHLIDFSDLEHDALSLLQMDQVKALLREQFEEVMVDEYQDINPLQEAIIQGVSCHNRFMVGDVKQSIYGFRLANPYLFLEKYERYQADESEGQLLILAENFRSSHSVIKSVNLVFQALMDKVVGDMVYDEKAALIPGLSASEEERPTELVLVDQAENGSHEPLDPTEKEWTSWADFHYLFSRIVALIDEEKASYKDIAILLPTRTHLEALETVASQWKVPLISDQTDDYFKRTEIAVILSLLKVIDNPYQDIPLVATLRSPIYGLKEKALASIRSQSSANSFYRAVIEFVNGGDALSKDSTLASYQDQVQVFLKDLTHWRKIAHQESLASLIGRLYQDTLWKDRVTLMENGQQRVANLEALVSFAADIEQTGSIGLNRFIDQIENMISYNEDLISQPKEVNEELDAVRVLTIHGSKGLEFPYVFLMDLTNRFRFYSPKTQSKAKSNRLFLSFDDGIALDVIDDQKKLIYTSVVKNVLQVRQDKKMLAEEMRKLYVAMTRAKKQLILIGRTTATKREAYQGARFDDNGRLSTYERLHASCFLDWLAPIAAKGAMDVTIVSDSHSLIPKWQQEQAKRSKLAGETNSEHEEQNERALESAEPKSASLQEDSDKIAEASTTDQQSSFLQIDWASLGSITYDHLAASQTTAYQAVSEIKQIIIDPDELELEPIEPLSPSLSNRFCQPLDRTPFASKTDLTPTARGTLVHELFKRWAPLCVPQAPKDREGLLQQINQAVPAIAKGLPLKEQVSLVEFFDRHIQPLLPSCLEQLHAEEAFTLVIPAQMLFQTQGLDDSDRVMVHGIIDLFIERPDGLILLDYKTDHIKRKSLAEYAKRYVSQMTAYTLALEAAYHKPVLSCSLAFTSIDQLITLALPHLEKGN